MLSRHGWVLAGLSVTLLGALGPDAAALVRQAAGPSFPDAVLAIVSLSALAVAAWTTVVVAAVLTGASSRVIGAMTPAVLHRALLAGAVGALVAAPAHAGTQVAPDQRHSVHGLPLPDRPDVAEPVVPTASSVVPRPAEPVEVRAGDTLWAISARSLPAGASDARIARATARWYEANRDVIGADPDLIQPAQQLIPPIDEDRS